MADKRNKDQKKKQPDLPERRRGPDSKPVKMGGMSNAAMEGAMGNAAAQDVGNTGSSGEGEATFTNPDYNIPHNPDMVEGLEEQRKYLDKGAGHLTEQQKRRRDEKRK